MNTSLSAKDLMYQREIEERDEEIATLTSQVKTQKEALYHADIAFNKVE